DGRLREMLPRIVPGQPGNPPETPLGAETRAAAVWALGLLHEGKPDAALGQALVSRLTDLPSPGGAERERVRVLAAVTLGRMKDQGAAQTLRRFYGGKPTLEPVNNACGWALWQITGEPVPPPGVIPEPQPRWFLSRLD